MKCQGAGKPPKSLYKAIHHYAFRNGRPWYQSGWGECSHCLGGYCVKPTKDNKAVIVHHKPISECNEADQRANLRRKRYWISYYNQNHITGGTTIANWGGPIDQRLGVVENASGVRYYSTGVRQVYEVPYTNTFRVELQSGTTNESGNYVFNINNQVWLGPTDRMTLVVDYATWNTWNNSITVSNYARIEYNNLWNNWVMPPQAIQGYTYADVRPAIRQRRDLAYTRPIEDPVAVMERRQREAEALFQRVQAESRAKDEAKAKAEATLLSLLTPEQRKEYKERGRFHIRGSKGTLYRILHGSSGNVRQVLSEADEGRGLHAFCAHPRMRVAGDDALGVVGGVLPHEDAMIAQMLQLMVDEDSFLAVANRHW